MKVTVFLDTNVILDYLENRDEEVRYLVERMLRSDRVRVVTSIFNIIETIDKEKDIIFVGKLLLKRYSFDEIARKRRSRNLSDEEKNMIADKINQLLRRNRIETYALNETGYEKAMELIQEYDIQSQDALIVATFLSIEGDYFVSNDGDLIKELRDNEICKCFNLRNENDRRELEQMLFGEENESK